jgi:hypothetical protein
MNYTDEKFERFIKGEISENALLGIREEWQFFKGDRVRCIRQYDNVHVGDTGTVMRTNKYESDSVGVKWDEPMGGHNLAGLCDYKYGWWMNHRQLELID